MISIGSAIEVVKNMDEQSLQDVQSVIAREREEEEMEIGRETIIRELTKYLNSGSYSGLMGDILPFVAASSLQPGHETRTSILEGVMK